MKKLIASLFAIIVIIALFAGCGGMNTEAKPGMETEPKPESTITADEARAILKTWADEHPFQLGSEIEPGNDEHTVDGVEYYRFYLGITRLGVAEILVHKETGEIFHLTSPYNDVGFEPVDDWYNREHAS